MAGVIKGRVDPGVSREGGSWEDTGRRRPSTGQGEASGETSPAGPALGPVGPAP